MDMNAIGSALASLKTATDITKLMLDIRDDAKFQEKATELRRAVLDAYESAISAKQNEEELIDEIRDLKNKIVSLETWKNDLARYELFQLAEGGYVYKLKSDDTNGEPPHYLCANCVNDDRKSIMNELRGAYVRLHCPKCSNTLSVTRPAPTAPTQRRDYWR